MIKKLLLIILIILITGCTVKQKEVVVLTKYVCPDGWVVASSDRCPKSEIRAEPAPNISEEKKETLPLKSPFLTVQELNIISENILNKINEERTKLNLTPYIEGTELESVAQDSSLELLQKTTLRELNERLKANTVFYFESGENMALIPRTDETDIGGEAVQKWMENSEQRQLLLDKDFTHTGIGITCDIDNCYVVLDLISWTRPKYFIIEPGAHAFETIYNTSFPYNLSINFTVALNSRQNFDFIVVANQSSYEYFDQNMGYNPISLEKDIKNATFSIIAEKGYGIILIPLEKYSDSVIFYELEFNEFVR